MEKAGPKLEQPARQSPAHAGVSGWNLIVGSFGVVLWLAVAWQVLISIPRGARLFAEFHVAVPLFTQMVVRFGQFAVPLLAVVTLVMCLKVRRYWAWLWFLIVLPGFLICAVFMSLYIPTATLLRALGGDPAWWECI